MSWTYDPTVLPVNGIATATNEQKKNYVRLLIGDINTNRQFISDEAIFTFISMEPNVWWAAAAAAEAVFRDVMAGGAEDQKVGETRIRMKNVNEYLNLSKFLRARGGTHMLPSAGGIYTADRENAQANTDLIQPNVEIGMHDIDNNSADRGVLNSADE